MKKSKLSKTKYAYRSHAITRYKERYDTELSYEQYYALGELITTGKSMLNIPQTDSRTIHVLKIGGLIIVAVWSKTASCIVTFLIPDMIRKEIMLMFIARNTI